MAAFIKKYTWWTIDRCKKTDQAYKLIAISQKKQLSGSSDNSKQPACLEVVGVTFDTAWKKIKEGAVVFGIFPSKFKQTFDFQELKNDRMPGGMTLDAEMNGVFSLNVENPEALAPFLLELTVVCPQKENVWDENDLQLFLEEETKQGLESALRARVVSASPHALLSQGDDCKDAFRGKLPDWVAVHYLHTSFTSNEGTADNGSSSEEQVSPEQVKSWEDEYNEKVEAAEREKAEGELETAIAQDKLERLNQKFAVELATIETKKKQFWAKHPILDVFATNITPLYIRRMLFLLRHPILSAVIAILILSACSFLTSDLPVRVQIRIDGKNDSAVKVAKDALREHFKKHNAQGSPKVDLLFAATEPDSRVTEEFKLRKRFIAHFEENLENFTDSNQDCIEGKFSSTPISFSVTDGGFDLLLKKKVYIITVKNNVAAQEKLKIILRGSNSIQRDLENYLKRRYAEKGIVEKFADSDTSIELSFHLRSGNTVDKLARAIQKEYKVRTRGNNPLYVDATHLATLYVFLDVSAFEKDPAAVKIVEHLFQENGISVYFRGRSTIQVDVSEAEINKVLSAVNDPLQNNANLSASLKEVMKQFRQRRISGFWQKKENADDGTPQVTYVFNKLPEQEMRALHIVLTGAEARHHDDFSKLRKKYALDKNGNTYTFSYPATAAGEARARELKNHIEYNFRDLKFTGKVRNDKNSVTLTYTFVKPEQVRSIGIDGLSSVERAAVKELLGGSGNGARVTVPEKSMTKTNLDILRTKHKIEITSEGKAVKIRPQELTVVIQGTPDRATKSCLNSQKFQSRSTGNYVGKYYTEKEKTEKLAALERLAPALTLTAQENGRYVFLQKKRVKWSVMDLPEVKEEIGALMNGSLEGYLAESEISALLKKLAQYDIKRRTGADGMVITVSQHLFAYNVMFFLGVNDDPAKIRSALEKSFGKNLGRVSSLRGNPQYFTFSVKSAKDLNALKEEIYEITSAACSSVKSRNIVVKQNK